MVIINKPVFTLKGHKKRIDSLSIPINGKILLSASMDTTFKLWDLETGDNLYTSKKIPNFGKALISPDGEHILISDFESIFVWDVKQKEEKFKIQTSEYFVKTTDFITDSIGSKVIISKSTSLEVRDFTSRKQIAYLKPDAYIHTMSIAPDDQQLVIGGRSNMIYLWDLRSNSITKTFDNRTESVELLAFSPNQNQFLSASNVTMKLWDIDKKEVIHEFRELQKVNCIDFTSDGNYFISSSEDTVKLWDIAEEKSIFEFKGHSGSVQCVTFTKGGNFIVSGSDDKSIKVWPRLDELLK